VFSGVCKSFGIFALSFALVTIVGFLDGLRRSHGLGSLFLSLPALWLPDCVKDHQQQDHNGNEFDSRHARLSLCVPTPRPTYLLLFLNVVDRDESSFFVGDFVRPASLVVYLGNKPLSSPALL